MELTVQEFFEHSILEKKIRNQIEIILKHFERIDKDAKYGCENWCVKEIYEKPNNMWDINMYALGNKYYEVYVYTSGQMGPVYVKFPVAYLFMSENNIKKDIDLVIKSKK